MAYYHADLLFVLARESNTPSLWREAAAMFERAIEADPRGRHEVKISGGKKAMRAEAAFAAIYCLHAVAKIEENQREQEAAAEREHGHPHTAGYDYKPLPIRGGERQLLRAIDTYLRLVPQAPERARILYQKARIFYEANHFKEAAAIFENIVMQYRTDPLAVVAANLLLDCLNLQKKFSEIGEWVERLRAMPELMMDEQFRLQIERLRQSLSRRQR